MTSKSVNSSKCPRTIYLKIIYENSNSICCDNCDNWFHLKCTKMKLKDFKRFLNNPKLKFICSYCQDFSCPKCNKAVFSHQNGICCDHCQKWLHLKCTNINKIDYFNLEGKDWVCSFCFSPPFAHLNDEQFLEMMMDNPLAKFCNHQTSACNTDNFSKICSVCTKETRSKKTKLIPCFSCNSLIHRKKCANIPLNQLLNFKKATWKNWECNACLVDKFPFSNMRDEDIVNISYNSLYNCACLTDIHDLEKINFKRFDYHKYLDSKHGPDPDNLAEELFNLKPDFDYFSIHDFHKLVNKLPKSKNSFSLFHTNIQSLNHNFDDLNILLSTLKFDFDIIALTETWNSIEKKNTFNPGKLEGYYPYQGTMGNTLRGGCGIYIKQNLKYFERKDLNISFYDVNNEFQSFWIEIINKNSANIILGTFYRHPKPNSDTTFNQKLNDTLSNLINTNKIVMITGDFNYDLFKADKNPLIKQFIDTIYSNLLQPCILEPTRIVDHQKSSLIDNIFINTIEKHIKSGNLTTKVSDHLPNFIIVSDKSNFINDIYNDIQTQFADTLNTHAPYKFLSKQDLKWKQSPWIHKGIQKLMKVRDTIHRKYLRSKSSFWFNRFKYYRNLIKKLIFKAKKEFYNKYFEKHKCNSKKIWKGIGKIIHKQGKTNSGDIYIKENNNIYTDPSIVTNKFNEFYTTIANKLVDKIDKSNNKYQDFLKNPNQHSMFLKEVEPGEVLNILLKLDTTKAADIYGISPKFVQFCSKELFLKLTKIFNLSFKVGKFPDLMKIAEVIPIFKAGSSMEIGNYRPISLLPIFGKNFEKIMHSRLYSFIESQNILHKNQYGFQKNKSTEQALIDIQSKIVGAFENKETPCCIFLDFAKAFDTVNHHILSSKLHHYGIRGNALNWINSYLTNRKQCVKIGNTLSSELLIENGVPQGSVLGPLLFLIYINDINESSKILNFQLFADDTCIFLSHKNVKSLETCLNTELKNVHHWLAANKLSLNVSKSNVLTFRTKNMHSNPILDLNINGEKLNEKTHAKYLGLIFDNKLLWHHHLDHVASKLIKGNGLLAKLRHFVPSQKLKMLYNALIQPHLDYGSLSWSSAAQSNLDYIQKFQNKSIRTIHFKKTQDATAPLFRSSKILPTKQNIMLNQTKFIWKYVNFKLPPSISEIFNNFNITHNIRNTDDKKLILPHFRTNYGTKFTLFEGIKTWNTILSGSIRNTKSLCSFKSLSKTLLISTI